MESGEPHTCHLFASVCCCTRLTACACWTPHRVCLAVAYSCLLSVVLARGRTDLAIPLSQATIFGFVVAYSSISTRWYAFCWRQRSRKGARKER